MSLHVISGSTTVNHSGAETNIISLLQSGGGIGAEQSAQERNGVLPSLIGLDAQDDAAAALLAEYVKVYGNTWANTDYIRRGLWGLTATAGAVPVDRSPFVVGEVQFGPEEDIICGIQNSGAVDHQVAIFLSYAPKIPYRGGKIITRQGAVTAADYTTTAAFGTAVSITDLDPTKVYRIHALGGVGGADCGILRLSSPTFGGKSLSVLIADGLRSMTYMTKDSLLHRGNSTLQVDASGGHNSLCNYEIWLEEWGTNNLMTPAASAAPVQQDRIQGARATKGGVAGAARGLMRSFM